MGSGASSQLDTIEKREEEEEVDETFDRQSSLILTTDSPLFNLFKSLQSEMSDLAEPATESGSP